MATGKLIVAQGGNSVEWDLFRIGQVLPQSFVAWGRVESDTYAERVRLVAEAWSGPNEGARELVGVADLRLRGGATSAMLLWPVTLPAGLWKLKLHLDSVEVANEFIEVTPATKTR